MPLLPEPEIVDPALDVLTVKLFPALEKDRQGVPEMELRASFCAHSNLATIRSSAVTRGEVVAWVDVRREPAQVLAHEFATGSMRQLTSGEDLPLSAAAGGRYNVWVGYRTSYARSGDPEVFLYDLATHERRRLTTGGGAAVSGEKVAVVGSRGLQIHRVSTGRELDLSSGDRSQVLPDVDGERVVWMETSPGRRDILLRDLGSGEAVRINRSVAGLSQPAISGDRMVWQGEEGGVFLYTIPSG